MTSSETASDIDQKSRGYRYSWVVLSASLLAYCIYMFQRSDISTATPGLTAAYGWSAVTIGWINSAMVWSYAVMQIPFGYVCDRWLGPRATVSLGTALLVIGAVLFGPFLPDVGVSIVVRILIGTGSAAILVPANSMLANWFPSSRRGLQTAILFAGGQVAMVVASLLMPVLVGGTTKVLGLSVPQTAYFVVGLPMIAAIPLVFRFARNRPEDVGLKSIVDAPAQEKAAGESRESISHVLRHSSTLYVLTFAYVGFVGGSNINAWLTLFFVNVYGMSRVNAALVFTLVSVLPWVVGQPIAGALGDRIGHRRLVISSLLVSTITVGLLTALVAVYGTVSYQVAVVLLVVFWSATSAMVNSWPLTTEYFSPKVAGTVAGVMNTGGNLAGAATTLIPGYFILDTAHSSYLPVFAFGTLVVGVGLVASLFLPKRKRGEEPSVLTTVGPSRIPGGGRTSPSTSAEPPG